MVKFQPDSRGIAAFLKSPEVRGMLDQAGRTIAGRAGDGFGSRVTSGRDRDRAIVMAESRAAKRKQASEHTLERSVGGGL